MAEMETERNCNGLEVAGTGNKNAEDLLAAARNAASEKGISLPPGAEAKIREKLGGATLPPIPSDPRIDRGLEKLREECGEK